MFGRRVSSCSIPFQNLRKLCPQRGISATNAQTIWTGPAENIVRAAGVDPLAERPIKGTAQICEQLPAIDQEGVN
jgi:hypothetical protein